jgi:hypothetical protein
LSDGFRPIDLCAFALDRTRPLLSGIAPVYRNVLVPKTLAPVTPERCFDIRRRGVRQFVPWGQISKVQLFRIPPARNSHCAEGFDGAFAEVRFAPKRDFDLAGRHDETSIKSKTSVV